MNPAAELREICLIRLSALGDVAHAVPLVKTLQQVCPNARLTWIIGSKEIGLVERLDGVRFVVYDKSRNLRSFLRIRQQLKPIYFDALILAQTSARANLLSLAVQAKRRIGFGRPYAAEGHHLFIQESIPLAPKTHQAEAVYAFAPYLLDQPHLTLAQADRRIPVGDEARAYASKYQPTAKHAVLISPCSSHPLRNWTAQGYAAVADWIVSVAHRPVILVGGPSTQEMAMGQAIESAMTQPVTNLIGQDTLEQALAMFERACILITPDSGPAHIADSYGTSVVGLYAATRVASSGPWASQSSCVDAFSTAAKTFTGREPEQLKWNARIEKPGVMSVIEPAQVIEKLASLLV